MYCPGCSSQSADGAKFCKTCGMNLTIVTQALVGSVVVTDPLRDREYKRARKSISDGIQGTAVGASLIVAAALGYWLLPGEKFFYSASLVVALLGIILFFRSIGRIIDAKIGPKLLDPALQPKGTGPLTEPAQSGAPGANGNPSRRLPSDGILTNLKQQESSRVAVNDPGADKSLERSVEKGMPRPLSPLGPNGPTRVGTGRVNREHSAYLRDPNKADKPDKLDREDDILSKIRN